MVMRALLDGMPNYPELYNEVFLEQAFQDLPPRRVWDHQINLVPGHTPIWGQCYLLATRERVALKEFMDTKLETRKIKKSDSPYTSPFFFRLKPGTMELCSIQDYQRLNEITIKDQYPLPLISDMLTRVKDS
jgi:hypothetical protein